MNTNDLQATTWEEFLREFGLDRSPTSEQSAGEGATLAPLRAEVERLGLGRPRKQPPVPVADGMRYCWAGKSVLPLASFDIDRWRADGRKLNCRRCEASARARRKRERNARLESQSTDAVSPAA